MAAVWKFPLTTDPDQEIEIPAGAEPLTVGFDPTGALCLWAAVDPDAERVRRAIRIAATGDALKATPIAVAARYIGSIQTGPLVLHIFDHGEPALDPGPSDG